jgi:hypothetical protein
MANKLKKYLFGALGVADGGAGSHAGPKIPVESANIDGTEIFAEGGAHQIYILKQKGARRFKITGADDRATAVCKLVNKAGDQSSAVTLAVGEMTIMGRLNGNPVLISKINGRTCADFSGRRYKWSLQDDSTQSIMNLTLIS